MDSDPPPRAAASTSFDLDPTAADPGEDPFSTDPLQATGSTLIGALIALVAMVLPIVSVVTDRQPPAGAGMVSLPAAVSEGTAAPVNLRESPGLPVRAEPRQGP